MGEAVRALVCEHESALASKEFECIQAEHSLKFELQSKDHQIALLESAQKCQKQELMDCSAIVHRLRGDLSTTRQKLADARHSLKTSRGNNAELREDIAELECKVECQENAIHDKETRIEEIK